MNKGHSIPLKKLDNDNYVNGFINVITDYPWTVHPVNHQEVPFIILKEYEQDIANIFANALYWTSAIVDIFSKNENMGPYEGLYTAEKTGTIFIFPYYESYNFIINPTWTESKGVEELDTVAKIIEFGAIITKARSIFNGGSPGININKPRVWEGSESLEYSFSFYLFNTINPSINIPKNLKLINRLKMCALHDQINIMAASPPAIFEVEIPKIRYSPASIISSLEISNEGQLNYYKEYGNIPDAYLITIRIKELITESRQILNSLLKDNKKVVSSIKSFQERQEEFKKYFNNNENNNNE